MLICVGTYGCLDIYDTDDCTLERVGYADLLQYVERGNTVECVRLDEYGRIALDMLAYTDMKYRAENALGCLARLGNGKWEYCTRDGCLYKISAVSTVFNLNFYINSRYVDTSPYVPRDALLEVLLLDGGLFLYNARDGSKPIMLNLKDRQDWFPCKYSAFKKSVWR